MNYILIKKQNRIIVWGFTNDWARRTWASMDLIALPLMFPTCARSQTKLKTVHILPMYLWSNF